MKKIVNLLPSIVNNLWWFNLKLFRGDIYMRTSPSGKSYIGQTTNLKDRNRRWNKLTSRYAGPKVENARKKYRPENFSCTILFTIISPDFDLVSSVLNEKEKFFIEKYDTFNNGYNSTHGGDEVPDNSKRVVQLTKDFKYVKTWNSIVEIENYYHSDKGNISRVCNGKRITAFGFRWVFEDDWISGNYKYVVKSPQLTSPSSHPLHHNVIEDTVRIVQLSTDGTLIKIWNSYKELVEKFGCKTWSDIKKTCTGKRKTCIKYKWMFYDDYLVKIKQENQP